MRKTYPLIGRGNARLTIHLDFIRLRPLLDIWRRHQGAIGFAFVWLGIEIAYVRPVAAAS